MDEVNETGEGMPMDRLGHGGDVDALVNGAAPLPIVGEVVREPKGRSSEPWLEIVQGLASMTFPRSKSKALRILVLFAAASSES